VLTKSLPIAIGWYKTIRDQSWMTVLLEVNFEIDFDIDLAKNDGAR
jgi:hypothetical protein